MSSSAPARNLLGTLSRIFVVVLIAAGLGLAVPGLSQAAPAAGPQASIAAAPTIFGVLPDAGPIAGGTEFYLFGTDLTGTTSVTFGGVPATNIVVNDDEYLTGNTPAHAVGAVDVVVTTPGGSATDTGGFTYQAAPVVTGVAPPTGSYLGGQDVTITGTGLSDATDVTFGGVESPTVFWVGDSLVARTPPHAAGLVDVAVTTPGGTGTLANSFTYIATPSAPRSVTATGGNGRATVSWLAPASTGGSPITKYTVSSAPEGRTCVVGGAALTCAVPGLTNGRAYTFTVTATNALGTSPRSAASAPVTPATVPGPVRGVRVVSSPGPGETTVSWLAPAANGGAPVSGNRIRVSLPNNPSVYGPWVAIGGNTRAITGLTRGANYRVQIAAGNRVGYGPVTTFAFKQPNVPGPIRAPRVASFPDAGRAVIAWTWPVSDGGATVTSYLVRVSRPNQPTVFGPWMSTPRVQMTLAGLTLGANYRVEIVAVNSQGGSTPVGFGFRQPNTPSAIQSPRITSYPSPGAAAAVWQRPVSDGGAPILRYLVRISEPNSSTVFGPWRTAGSNSWTFTGLTKGASYKAQVIAVNSQGNSPLTTFGFRQATTPSAIPSARITAFPAPGQAIVAWVRPASDGGSRVTGYMVRVSRPNSTSEFGPWIRTTATSKVLAGLRKGAVYRVQMAANNSQGTSPLGTLSFTQQK
ncbi:MAG: trimeric autotransporter adhesin [Actinomycetota bacterium]|nr:trimeric autotransporter adhesin [Actinomycetota bacterium]